MTSTPGVGMRVKRLLAGDPLTSLTTKADQLAGYFRPRSFTDLDVGATERMAEQLPAWLPPAVDPAAAKSVLDAGDRREVAAGLADRLSPAAT